MKIVVMQNDGADGEETQQQLKTAHAFATCLCKPLPPETLKTPFSTQEVVFQWLFAVEGNIAAND